MEKKKEQRKKKKDAGAYREEKSERRGKEFPKEQSLLIPNRGGEGRKLGIITLSSEKKEKRGGGPGEKMPPRYKYLLEDRGGGKRKKPAHYLAGEILSMRGKKALKVKKSQGLFTACQGKKGKG